jgi:hypothetical protein
MCLGSDELRLGTLIDFHTRSIRAYVLACSRVGRGAGVETNMAGWEVMLQKIFTHTYKKREEHCDYNIRCGQKVFATLPL